MTGLFTLIAASVVAACGDPVVGAQCATGYERRGSRCVAVDAGAPPSDSGGGGVDAGDGATADGALDGATSDGALDGAIADVVVSDVPVGDRGVSDGPDGTVGDGATGDGPTGCAIGELTCGPTCARPNVDPNHCGDCDVRCAMDEVCSDGTCAPRCEAPLVFCDPLCVDTDTDPDHCGSCGNRCASGLCVDGMCVSGVAGHIVLIGHDYRNSRAGMRRLAGNAIFLAPVNPVRVLAFEGAATSTSIAGIDRAIESTAMSLGRSWMRTSAPSADEVPLLLADADVFVVYPQRNATDADLLGHGTAWANALMQFVRLGKIVVVFDGETTNAGTWQVLSTAGLLGVRGKTEVSTDTLSIPAAADADALVAGVPRMYAGELTTVRFDTTDMTVVVEHPLGPVVVHRTMRL